MDRCEGGSGREGEKNSEGQNLTGYVRMDRLGKNTWYHENAYKAVSRVIFLLLLYIYMMEPCLFVLRLIEHSVMRKTYLRNFLS